MDNFKQQGNEIRERAKQLVLDYMKSNSMCGVFGPGMKQAGMFRECGFDWRDYPQAPSRNQQFWIIAALKELEVEDKVEQVRSHGPWRLK